MDQINLLEKEIIEKLPQLPYIVDQVGEALEWRKSEENLGSYLTVLKGVSKLCDYVKVMSEGNFYETHLVIASILMDIPDVISNEKFERFKSASNSVENTLKKLLISPEEIKERGYYRALTINASNLGREDEECLAILLLKNQSELEEILSGMKKAGVKAPITSEDYVKVLGVSLVLANLRMSNLDLLNETRELLNNLEILLNTEFNY